MACVHTLVLARLASLELWDSLFPLSVLSLTAFFSPSESSTRLRPEKTSLLYTDYSRRWKRPPPAPLLLHSFFFF